MQAFMQDRIGVKAIFLLLTFSVEATVFNIAEHDILRVFIYLQRQCLL